MLATTRLSLALFAALGVGVVAVLATYAGVGTVYRAFDDLGWPGLGGICVLQLGSMALCAAAWKSVADETSFLFCLTARFIRSGVSNLAGVIPTVGEIAGARALSLLGVSAGVAAASTVVDVAIESLAQAIYTIIGLIPLMFWSGRTNDALACGDRRSDRADLCCVHHHPTSRCTRLAERFITRIARMLGFPAHQLRPLAQRARHLSAAPSRLACSPAAPRRLVHERGPAVGCRAGPESAVVARRRACAAESRLRGTGCVLLRSMGARHSGRNFRSCRRCAWRRCCERPCVLAHLARAGHPARTASHSRLVWL